MTDFAKVIPADKILSTDAIMGERSGVGLRIVVSRLSDTIGSLLIGLPRDTYPNTTQTNVPRGIVGTGSITGGSGGANGTFALAFSGGNFGINPTGTFKVAGGAIVSDSIKFTTPGEYIGASPTAPTLSFAASIGLTGASATATIGFLIANGARYWTLSADGLSLKQYQNISGVATAVTPTITLSTEAGYQDILSQIEVVAADAQDSANFAEETVNNSRIQAAALRRASLGYSLAPGLVNPADLGFTDWEYPFTFKYYSDGALVWPLIKVTPTWREEWAAGNVTYRDPSDKSIWRSINPSRYRDPTRQGTAFTSIYFRWSTGVDATGGGRGLSDSLPFKSFAYAWAYAMANPTCRIYCLDKVVGANSMFDTYSGSGYSGNLLVDQNVSVVARPDDLSGRSYITPMREQFTDALFAFADQGDGLWMSANTDIPDTVKMTVDMMDLGELDLDGCPTPMDYVTGSFASLAAIKAALPFGSWWVDEVASPKKLYVRRYDGLIPITGVNWSWSEYTPYTTIRVDNAKIAVFDGFTRLGNAAATDIYSWIIQPKSNTVTGTWVDKTGEVWFNACEAHGGAGGGFYFNDIRRGGCVNRKVKHCRLDGFNNSVLQTYTNILAGDPNRTREGRDVHLMDMHGLTQTMGQHSFRNQLGASGSSNGPTEHSQVRTTSLSSITIDTNGCCLATVSGARSFHIDPFCANPTIADSTPVPKALIWNDGTSDARGGGDLTVFSITNIIGGSGPLSTVVWSHAVTNAGTIKIVGWKGQVRKKVTSGTITDMITGAPL
jgi:hypothetical protein